MPIDESAVEAVLIDINSCFSLFNLYWDCLIHQCKGQDGRTAEMWTCMGCSLAWPDPLRTGAYRLEIISAVLRGSGTVHSTKKF